MKKFFAFILLLCHMNTSMFLPQVAEDDQYDITGRQIDDINSVSEYVDQVLLGNYDPTPEDEDSDNGQDFHVVKSVDYNYLQPSVFIQRDRFVEIRKHSFSEYMLPQLSFPALDVATPPPDMA
ncbi:hypothetical protein [Ferruginibacter sp. HRS2-29]|uniref:hypothetical protein n=1 Tax=Ferruginibacter sp. HRS2-29 TaxID=2487334 RepID=UPI0020CCE3E2|nr:hypothetical protein [Ferruginibacter sp. HRS2-29]MCP9750825.1 hypothetical protein [Ferruginibacter sp. HRS2-29]